MQPLAMLELTRIQVEDSNSSFHDERAAALFNESGEEVVIPKKLPMQTNICIVLGPDRGDKQTNIQTSLLSSSSKDGGGAGATNIQTHGHHSL